jgi:diacylglycerol O-acyltransferase / wax synthase
VIIGQVAGLYTAVSYGRTFAVGIVACPDNVDDVTSIARGIEDVVAELKKTAEEKTGQSAGMTGIKPPASATKSTATTQFAPPKKWASGKKPTPSTKRPA